MFTTEGREVHGACWICLSILLMASAVEGVEAGAEGAGTSRPIIVILVDDLGWTDLTSCGSEYYETPNIDRLALEGMRFTAGYAACAVCSPTRAAVMTGRYPARLGVTDWIRARFQGGKLPADGKNPSGYVSRGDRPLECPRNALWLESDEVTIAEALDDHPSCYIGKWHLGMDAWYPDRQGFDLNVGGCDYGQPPSYFDPYSNKRLAGIPTLKPRKAGEYLTDREGHEAEKFIRAHAEESFLLFYAPYAVHTPIQAKEDLTRRYREKTKTNQKNARYAAMIHSLDDAVGRILRTLDELKLSRRAVVVFTSDNGGLLGPTSNLPLRDGKGSPYEGGIRVPFLVRWPLAVPAGSVSHAPVSSIDLLPTLLELAGVTASTDIDGVSLVSHLRSGGKTPLPERALFWHFPHYRYKNWGPYSIVRQGHHKLIRWWEGPRHELYDLSQDLGEKHDLSGEAGDLLARMQESLDEHLTRVGARLPRKKPSR